MNPANGLSVDWRELARLGNGLSQHLRNHCSLLSCIYPIPLAIALNTKTKNKVEAHSFNLKSFQGGDEPGLACLWLELGVLEIRAFASTSEGSCEGNFPYSP